uniref:Ig-like domain-containing protein n=1 Tax=Labrus bergylta TaxID=56723 RepID=A0A3Q3GBN7_9LABR
MFDLIVFPDVLCVSVVKGEDTWRVTHSSAQICAVKGSTVEIPCTYTYPSRLNEHDNMDVETFWYTKKNDNQFVDVKTDPDYSGHPDYSGRVEYLFHENVCTLRIKNLRERDSAVYKFMFTTNQPGGSLTGDEGVTLSITGNILILSIFFIFRVNTTVNLFCYSSCNVADNPSYVWYRNGKKMTAETSSITRGASREGLSAGFNLHPQHFIPLHSSLVTSVIFVFFSPQDAPSVCSASVSPAGEIRENSRVTVTCSCDANPAPEYTWYNVNGRELSKESELVFSSVQSSDSGRYYCKAKNDLGERTSGYVKVEVKCE